MTALHRPLTLLVAGLALLVAATANGDPFTRQFPIANCDFNSTGGNAYIKLKVNRQLYLSNLRCVQDGDCEELEELWITMLPETKTINFDYAGKPRTVRARVMEEFETVDGEVDEISRNYVADCAPMHDVYYFGEDVEDGEGHHLPDAWLAGRNGAKPGILMPDRAFLLGSRYFQELAENAKDRAEHTAMGLEVEVPAGVFRGCVEVTETTPLEPGEESFKTYCPAVGLVRDEDLELIAVYENAESPAAKQE
jgi:hypothetical protein